MKKLFNKVYLWFKQNERTIYLEYAFIALIILLPLLKLGYILTLDMIFTPKISMPTEVGNIYFFISLLHFLNYLIPSQIIEKIILFLIIFLSGVGMHRLIPTKNKWPKYFAAFLYIFNPFVYSRFMAGHFLLLLAYALAPFAVKAIFDFFESLDFKKSLIAVVWLTLISIVSMHSLVMICIFFVFAFVFFLIHDLRTMSLREVSLFLSLRGAERRSNPKRLLRPFGARNDNLRQPLKTIKFTLFIGLAFLILSSYWLVPFFTKGTPTSESISSFDSRNILGFQTVADKNFGVLFNTAALYGFWGENEGRYVIQKNIIPFWYILFIIIFVLVIWGIIVGYKDKNQRTRILIFAATSLLAYILAVGVAYGPMSQFILGLYQKIPLLKGFREPQKFVALLALSYAYLGALGVDDLLKRARKDKRFPRPLTLLLPSIFLIIPLLYSPVMLWGFGGQLQAVDYPRDWYQLNETLKGDKEDFRVLFLPWHQYMGFLFAGKVIANPAQNFFDKPIVQGDNMEFGQIYSQSNNPDSKYIEGSILKKRTDLSNMGEILLPLNIKYIILAKEVDWQDYDFLDKQTDLKLLSDTESLKVYQNLEFGKGGKAK